MSSRRIAWNWIVRHSQQAERFTFTAKQLAEGTSMNIHTAKRFLQFLRDKKRVAKVRIGRGCKPTLYRLADASPLEFDVPGARPGYRVRNSRHNSARQRIWNSCRILRTFTLNDLIATSKTAYVTSSAYVRWLERAGLVRKIKHHAAQTGEFAVFRLNLDAGARHPIVRDDGVYCPNRHILYPYREAPNQPAQEVRHAEHA